MGWRRDIARAAGAEVAVATGDDVFVGTAILVACNAAVVEDAVGVGCTTEGVRDGVTTCCTSTVARESAERTSAFGRFANTDDVTVGVDVGLEAAIETTGVDLLESPTVPSDLPAASARTAGVPTWFANVSDCAGVGEFCASPCLRGRSPLISGIKTPMAPDKRTTMMMSDPIELIP